MMNAEEMEEFLANHSDILESDWTEAFAQGWDDVVFLWQVNEESISHICAERAPTLKALVEAGAELPPDTKEQLSAPAGEGRAWLLFVTDDWFASMCIEYVRTTNPSALN